MNAPWLERPRRLFRWLDMLKFSAEDFHNIGYSLGRLQSMLEISGEDEALDEKAAAVMKSNLLDIQKECSAIGLTMSVKSVQYVLSNLEEKRNCGFLKHAYGELNRRISDEIGDDLFFSVPKTHAQFYTSTNLFGNETQKHFNLASEDISEAGKCLALRRSSASVFHLMLVLERALKALHKTLGLSITFSPSWESILRPLTKERDKSFPDKAPIWQTNDDFLSQATTFLEGVKRAWRNPTVHVERHYSEEEAEEVFIAVRGFMKHLATELDQDGVMH